MFLHIVLLLTVVGTVPYAVAGAGFFERQAVSLGKDRATALCFCDVNGDGAQDVIVGTKPAASLSWQPSTGALVFGERALISQSEDPSRSITWLEGADLDGDGDLDLIASESEGGQGLRWFPNRDASGSFGEAQVIASDTTILAGKVVDLDLDGDADVLGISGDALLLWRQGSPGIFDSAEVIDEALGLQNAEAPDLEVLLLDGNEFPDIAVSFPVRWYRNTDGRPGNPETLRDDVFGHIVQGDFDGDAGVDLLFVPGEMPFPDFPATGPRIEIEWFEWNAEMAQVRSRAEDHFKRQLFYGFPIFASPGRLGDRSGLVLLARDSSTISFFDSGDTLGTVYDDRSFSMVSSMLCADLNGDGYSEIVVADRFGTSLRIFENLPLGIIEDGQVSEGAGEVVWDLTLSRPLQKDLAISLEIRRLTEVFGESVVLGEQVLALAAGMTHGQVRFPIANDEVASDSAVYLAVPGFTIEDLCLLIQTGSLGSFLEGFAWTVLDDDPPGGGFLAIEHIPRLRPRMGYRSDEPISDVTKLGLILGLEQGLSYVPFSTSSILGEPVKLPADRFVQVSHWADLDNDGDEDGFGVDQDLLVWIEQDGSSEFKAHDLRESYYPGGVADLNGDGLLDLISGSDRLYAAMNAGGGNFAEWVPLSESSVFIDVTNIPYWLGDFTGDGSVDIAMRSFDGSSMTLFENDGSGGLSAPREVTFHEGQIAADEESVRIGDIDGDGRADIVSFFGSPGPLEKGNLGWAASVDGDDWEVTFLEGDAAYGHSIDLSDSDLDGDTDIFAAMSGQLQVYQNRGAGKFEAPVFLAGGFALGEHSRTADVNLDGYPDVVTYRSIIHEVNLWLPNAGATELAEYDTWASNLGLDGPEGDSDSDGVSNLAEFAFGLDPARPDRYVTPVRVVDGQLEVSWKSRASGVHYQVEHSLDLIVWTPVNGTISQLPGEGGFQETRLRTSSSPESGYVRLRLAQAR